ncbi:L domain-like protein [Piromyces finnis]|uniref:L domain-like protein n=1 Tax=Piromyces finnis TaxID=1754191 RepID=A0A1Y1V2G1_9FUNG|nr:L domain-like protein [Piromyces finnis]|eukprot:ORX45752.1 L domain-like protein [Piromyces finnis]
MLFNILLLSGLTILGGVVSAQDCNTLSEIFLDYGIDVYWNLGTNDCCTAYKDFEYPVIINCNQNNEIIKIHITNLYLENKRINEKFCKFNELISLELMNNGLMGEIPSCITSLTSLEYLNLSDNALTGSIPMDIENLSSLKELTLSKNNLTGEFPESLGNIGSLTGLFIDSNQLSGELPHSLDNLFSIKSFDVSDNQFSGDLPEEFYNMYTLEHGYFNNNKFTGRLDRDIGVFSVLSELDLTNNKFEGKIPSSIGFLQNLEWLSLAGNKFTGDFPSNIAKSKYLVYLDLSNNKFSSVPTALKRLAYLGYIDVSNNPNLKGELHLADEVESCYMDTNNVCVEGGVCQNKVRYCSNPDNNDFDLEAEAEEEEAGFEDVAKDDADELEEDEGDESDDDTCWVSVHGYPCCEGESLEKVYAEDVDGKWGYDFVKKTWCGISTYSEISKKYSVLSNAAANNGCWSLKEGYNCCIGCAVYAITDEGSWGVENGKWCGIPSYCSL